MPAKLVPGKAHGLQMDMAPPAAAAGNRVRLRIHADVPLADRVFEVSVNGQSLTPSGDVSAFYANPYDDMLSAASGRQAFTATAIPLRNGLNDVTLCLTSGPEVEITCVELAVDRRA